MLATSQFDASSVRLAPDCHLFYVYGFVYIFVSYVNLDDCWHLRDRDAFGNVVADPERFPSGMKSLADYVHSLGLKFGIYTDAGTRTCGNFPGSYGYEKQDAVSFYFSLVLK
jgi:alpha-galactosidase